jgi:hypothetical protein
MPKKLENSFISYDLQNGIIIAIFKEGIVIDLQAAKEILELRSEFTKAGNLPALIDGSKLKMMSFTKEARDFLSSDEARVGLKASALLVAGPVSRSLANFFLLVTVKKPMIPTKIFSDYSKALSWLNQFK